MNFIDEEIIEMTKHARQKKRMENIENQLLHTDIVKAIKEGQLTIEDETIEFTEIGFYEDQIRMSIPAAFEEMEPELMDIKYPSRRRPDYIYTSESTSINVTMKIMEQQIKEEELEDFTHTMMDILRKLQPDADMLDIGIKEVNGVQIGYFDFITKALDTKTYNVMFLFIVGDNVATGSVNCLKKEMNVWKPIAYGMMDSISIVNKLDEEGVV
ncbi:hypothetical protein [Aneurinibacillus aneurinilyticus]|uniref:Uncharacterized protein n=1 Tax=Aneurinibacillus aneurinilyticus ATCC 12856 TaxID=649747 RepID=U1WPY2_ANEAE|nr:hypothetical protein [Aneurinibacillus aneurinilyticus]ERI10669.1 hypothetical protein HMPREF0083_01239 [Aneurinibacillus aneurinilyticus ATCC 12856]MED0704754.1 hypothetical protein [Aneurinibacillus aneurinilyticus]MED0722643.1 hypothetical protein [Aneurinibacillus aneurinilyticus]MED0730892.1 hypothetical protein [Aneurinibacillus aneurinilyticus]MED0740513.1 hypothetical protein [Aneurinibacillus aneurinilyticus]